jgi:glycosyltransferase involved in cell wall biosynthesis
MRLLIISESPLEKIGSDYYAIDTWVRVPQHLAHQCEQVTLWSPVIVHEAGANPSPDSWRVELGKLKIEHHDYYNSFATYYRMWLRRVLSWRRRADRLIKGHDVVVLRSPSPMLSLVAGCAKHQRKPLILMVLANLETQSNHVINNHGLKRLFYVAIVKLLVRQEVRYARDATLVYVYSNELARRHGGGNGRVKLMQDPHLSLNDFIQRTDTCQSDEVRLLRVCWLLPSKGLEYLLEAVALLVATGRRVRLEIVGKERVPGYQASLERLAERLGIRDSVAFAGWVPWDKIHEVYLRNDIHVISSLGEGSPRVIVEGFARGLPLVCTAVGGCVDYLTHEENALLVPPMNPKAMALAVERLMRDGVLRRKIINHGYDMARSVTFEKLGLQLMKEIQSVVS